MSHLRETQLEDIRRGGARAPEHLDQCPQCRARLDEKRALARRMCKAFTSVHPSRTFQRWYKTYMQ